MTQTAPIGFYRFYNAGHGQGISEDLYLFTCSREPNGAGGVHSVYASQVAENCAALERIGYVRADEGLRKVKRANG